TLLLKDINPGAGTGLYDDDWGVINNSLYFHAWDGSGGDAVNRQEKLFVSDGTPAGTVAVPGTNGVTDAAHLVTRKGKLFYHVGPSIYSYTPGDAAGPRLLATVS